MKKISVRNHILIILLVILLSSYLFRHYIGAFWFVIVFSYSFGMGVVILLNDKINQWLKSRIFLRVLILITTVLSFYKLGVWIHQGVIFDLICSFNFGFAALSFLLYDYSFRKKEESSDVVVADDSDVSENNNP